MINIQKIFYDYNIQFDPLVNPGWLNICCPFHRPKDVDFFLGFKINGDYCHCWKCGSHPIPDVLSAVLNITRKQAREIIREYSDDTIIRNQLNRKQAQASSIDLSEFESLNKHDRQYLKSRNFDSDYLQQKYNLLSGGIVGKWKYRIIIPLYLNNQPVSWTSRDVTGKQKPRYKTLSIEQSVIDPKHIFYNIDNARGNTAGICEGPFDVMRMGDGFICGFGSSLEEAQIRYIHRNFKRVFMLFDDEPEAQKKARKYAEQLSVIGRLEIELVNLETGGDPGELPDSEVKNIRKELGI